jgi:hypothetical protein
MFFFHGVTVFHGELAGACTATCFDALWGHYVPALHEYAKSHLTLNVLANSK